MRLKEKIALKLLRWAMPKDLRNVKDDFVYVPLWNIMLDPDGNKYWVEEQKAYKLIQF